MPGVIVLLDNEHHERVERLWDTMEREFGIPRGYPGALPHLTLHLADGYDQPPTTRALEAIAASQPPFEARTTGLGVFTGSVPVVHLPVVRSPILSALHERLHVNLGPHCQEPVAYYAPDQWMPHITLGQSNVPAETYASLLPWLARQDLAWSITAKTLALAEDTPAGVNVIATVALKG